MNIFIWKSYGEVSVYEAETLDQVKRIWCDFRKVVLQFNDSDFNKAIEEFDNFIEKTPEEMSSYVFSIQSILNGLLLPSDIESFEYSTGFSKTR